MAIVTATITITFTSNYTGDHRICYRQVGTVSYDCSTLVTCLGGGASCSTTINVLVDDAACPVSFEGYVQAVCEDISSTNGRVAFITTYTPVDACESTAYRCLDPICDGLTVAVEDCGGTNPITIPQSSLGQVANFCVPNGTVMPVLTNYANQESTVLCCECVQITFTNPGASPKDYMYQECETRAQVVATLAAYTSITVCAINGTQNTAHNSGITMATGVTCYNPPIVVM